MQASHDGVSSWQSRVSQPARRSAYSKGPAAALRIDRYDGDMCVRHSPRPPESAETRLGRRPRGRSVSPQRRRHGPTPPPARLTAPAVASRTPVWQASPAPPRVNTVCAGLELQSCRGAAGPGSARWNGGGQHGVASHTRYSAALPGSQQGQHGQLAARRQALTRSICRSVRRS
jgi:hypothetical protein